MTDNTQLLREQSEETIDLRKWAGRILANWYWFVLSVALIGTLAFFVTRYWVPRYEAKATLLVKEDQKGTGTMQLFQDLDLFGSQKNIQNEIGILKSWTLARRTLGQLNLESSVYAVGRFTDRELYGNVPFRVTTGPDVSKMAGIRVFITLLNDNEYRLEVKEPFNITAKQAFNQPYQNGDFSFILSRNPNFDRQSLPLFLRTNKYFFVINDLDKMASDYQKALTVTLTDKMSSMLQLSIELPSGHQAIDYLNALMSEYIQNALDQKNQTATNTVKFIDDQLAGIKDTLKAAELTLQNFRSHNQVINISAEGQQIINDLAQLQQEKAMIDNQVNYYRLVLKYLQSNDSFSNIMAPSTMGISDPMLNSLVNNLVDLSMKKTSLETNAKENNPALVNVNLQIKDIQQRLIENVKNLLSNTEVNQKDINSRINGLTKRAQNLPETERLLTNITRQFDLSNEIYTFLLQRRAEAGITQASNVPDQMVIDEARPDTVKQVAPRNMVNYAIGLLLGLLLPLLVMILKDFFDFSVEERADVERLTDVPIVGTVGHNRHDDMMPVIRYTKSSIAESFRAIRTNLQFTLTGAEHKVVMITSSTGGEGKSFLAMNLAGIFSVTGKKVVVVGLDLRKPTVQKYLDVDNKKGVSTFLINRNTLDEILVPTEFPGLSLLPAGPIPPNPAELIERPEFANLIAGLRERFDIVILDTPPIALVTDAMLIARHADASLYVVRQKYTRKTALNFVNDLKSRPHVKNLGVVINDVVVPKYYGYKYGYGYGYGYGKGYGSGYYTDDK